MIVVNDIHKSFGKVKAVRGVSFDAPDGKITGLLGPNGAGKSTTLRVLYTVLRPDEGSASIGIILVCSTSTVCSHASLSCVSATYKSILSCALQLFSTYDFLTLDPEVWAKQQLLAMPKRNQHLRTSQR